MNTPYNAQNDDITQLEEYLFILNTDDGQYVISREGCDHLTENFGKLTEVAVRVLNESTLYPLTTIFINTNRIRTIQYTERAFVDVDETGKKLSDL